MRSLVWFRRDLRVNDHSALYHAAEDSTEGVIGLFVITPKQWQEHDEAPSKVRFWLDNITTLAEELAKLRIPLIIRTCDWFGEVPQLVLDVASQHGCGQLLFNNEYEVNESRRDAEVEAACAESGIAIRRFDDRVLSPPSGISTKDGNHYVVFTPYRRVWDGKSSTFVAPYPKPKKQPAIDVASSDIPESVKGFAKAKRNEFWQPGEVEALRHLKQFKNRIADYDGNRDVPSLDGTSRVSPYLAAGVLSPRQCFAMASQIKDTKSHEGVSTWVSELTWRDFYTHVLVGFPRVSMHRPFKLKTDHIPWRTDQGEFEAWCEGRTGYPIVDAGMRQLKQMGWMHNRLRMVTAMFLTKHLLIDWRWGERYFMRVLMDGDLAANNGGWQWSASTGTDAVPYFRIFNPFSQSKRFDPNGIFIKEYCPELADVPAAALHDPKKLRAAIEERDVSYPDFVVDYKFGRERALAEFKSLP